MNRYISNSTEETIAFGRRLGACLHDGDVLILTGDLGAGKTQLTKGIAQALGITSDVTSPTFTIQMVYKGETLTLNHFDLYRLEDPNQLEDTGLFDVLGSEGVCVIEWGEQFAEAIGDERLDVVLTRLDETAQGEEPAREICLVAHGTRAEALAQEMAKRL